MTTLGARSQSQGAYQTQPTKNPQQHQLPTITGSNLNLSGLTTENRQIEMKND